MRYAKLNKDWLLRGWTDEPGTIINWLTGDCRSLSERYFRVAQACDGLTDFHSGDLLPQANEILDKMIRRGMAGECARGDILEPYQRFRLADNPYIRTVHWSITGRCNLKCRHCYMESPGNRYGELTLADMLRLVDQFTQANVHQVELTGGEPFLRQDLLQIMGALADNKIAVSRIYSNGLLITEEIIAGIKRLGFVPKIQISFDGCGTHDSMRGLRGIEQATVDAIRRLRHHDFHVTVATSVDRTNISTLAATYELMKQLDIQKWRVSPPQEIGNWRHGSTALSQAEIILASEPIAARWEQDSRPFSLQLAGHIDYQEMAGQANFTADSYDCLSCRLTTAVLPDGTVLPCPAYTDTVVYKQMPNLLQQPFTKIWSQSALRSLIDLKKSTVLTAVSECTACDQFKYCGGGCRAVSLVATGEMLSKDPRLCEMFKNRTSELV